MHKRPVCCVCVLLMLFLCILDLAGVSIVRGNPLPQKVQQWIEVHPSAVICGEVQHCQDTEYSLSVYLKQVYLTDQSEKIPIRNIRVFLKENIKEDLKTGMIIQVKGELERISAPGNPGEFDQQQYYACQKIYYFMKNAVVQKKSRSYSRYGQALTELREKIAETLQKAAGDKAGIYQAMLLGEKSGLDEDVKMRYQMAGMIHILAISGLHISVLGMGLFSLLKKLSLGNVPAGLISLCVILQYGMLTGSSVSAMRAVSMFVLAVGARILGRSYDLLTALAVSAILLLLDTPAYLYSSSFLLSFGAVAGLGSMAPTLNRLIESENPWVKTLISSLAVQLMTLPVVLRIYGEVSILGIALNLIVLPTVSVVLVCGLCCSLVGVFSIFAAGLVLFPGNFLLVIYEKLCILAGEFPFCTWIGGAPEIWKCGVYYVVLAGGIRGILILHGKWENDGMKIRQKGMLLSVVLISVLFLGFRQRNYLSVTCLDIGQGDAIVIQIPGGKNIMVDGGSSSKKNTAAGQLLPYLKNQGISVVDAILLSHTDIDHISGVQELMDLKEKHLTTLRIKYLLLPDWKTPEPVYDELEAKAKRCGISVLKLQQGQKLQFGDATMEILSPEPGAEGTDPNEEGLVMELCYGKFRGLFTGDIGEETEKKLLPRLDDVDFLKVGHHGSRYSSCQEFLDRIRPEAAVISCSESNTYGHPSPETIKRLEQNGIKTMYTMKSGAVTVSTDGGHMWLETFCDGKTA
nr:DNA internalization-related competence protein ComEC/Rec2 [uncultured Blautia sp.]